MKIEDHNFNTDHEIKPRLAACDSTARPVETGLSNGFHQIRLISAYDPHALIQLGVWGALYAPPVGSQAKPQPPTILAYFEDEGTMLLALIELCTRNSRNKER